MAIRAFWQAYNRHDQLDRIELHDSEYGGAEPELEFRGDGTGFTRQWDEITSESNEKLINIQANRIQIGKYDFRPRIENATGFQILEDIRDSDNKRFHIVHKIDGTFEWAGWVTTRIFSYPEKDNNFFAHIRATDFEILKGIDYPLDDTRQTFLATFADILGELPEDTPIKTATSWVEQNVTARVGSETYDFLDEIRHETKALREFGRTGDETDQPITKFEAIERISCPGLLVKQVGGHVMIDQLTELADPQNVNETVYDHTGSVATTTQDVDRRQTGYTTTDNGTPTVKNTSENDTYPAIKTARNLYNHRTNIISQFVPSRLTLTDTDADETYQEDVGFDGNQKVLFRFDVEVTDFSGGSNASLTIELYTNGQEWDSSSGQWVSSGTGSFEVPLTKSGSTFKGSVDLYTDYVPNGEEELGITLTKGTVDGSTADITSYRNIFLQVQNPVNVDRDSNGILYELEQTGSFPITLDIDDSLFGDGPVLYSPGALRHDTGLDDTTDSSWRRRGQTIDYRSFHHNLLAEVIDMGRTNMRKLEAEIWGTYDPTKVLDYNGSYFYFAGGKYDGTRGKWRVTLMELDLQTDASDTFDDIPKFTDETGSGSGSTSSGGGGGLDQSTADARYFEESKNLSEGDPATIRSNIGTEIGTDVQAFSSTLQDLSDNLTSSAIELNILDGATLSTAELNQLDGNVFTSKIEGTTADFSGALDADTLRTDSGKFLAPTSYQFRNAGDSDFRDVEMAGLTATTGLFDLGSDKRLSFNDGFNWPSDATSPSHGIGLSRASDGAFSTLLFTENTSQLGIKARTDINFYYNQDKISSIQDDGVHIDSGDFYFDDTSRSINHIYGPDNRSLVTRIRANDSTDHFAIEVDSDGNGNYQTELSVKRGIIDIPNDLDVEGTATLATAQIQTLRTTLFKPDSISGMGGEFVFNGTTSVVSIDTGADTIVVEHAVFSNGDAVIVSSAAFDTGGFSNVELDLTSAGSAVSGGTQYDYTVNSGSDTDIEAGDTAVKVDGDLIYVNANEGDTNAPFLEGYSNVSGFSDSPLSGGTATPNWYIRNNEISVGNVFSADGGADTGTLAGLDFDSGALATGDGSLGSYTAGTVTGLQPRSSGSTRVFFGGADDKAGTNATFYATAEGKLFYDAMGGSLSARFREADFGTNNTAPSIDDNEWETDINRTGTDSGENRDTIIRGRYRHRFGINEVTLQCYAKRNINITSGVWDREHRVYLSVWDIEGGTKIAEDSVLIDFNTYQEFTLTLDISSLTVNNYYVIEVENYVFIDGDPANGGSDSATAETFLREDYFIDIGTG